MKMTFEFFCPTCPRKAEYGEEVRGDTPRVSPAEFTARARIAAMSHGWVGWAVLAADAEFSSLLVCPDCACDAIDCSRVTWTESERQPPTTGTP